MNDIGTRFKKNYENRYKFKLTRRTPVIIRIDGRAFHTYTKGFIRPFDGRIQCAMYNIGKRLLKDALGAKLAYTQSDEVSVLLTDWDTLQTDAWFDYNVQKLCSVSASIATCTFNDSIRAYNGGEGLPHGYSAQFDARAFNVPLEEVSNYFVWRAKDWYRNSVTMYAQSFFLHNELHGKSCEDMHEMLHNIGKNWCTDLSPAEKNGTFLSKHGAEYIQPIFSCINNLVESVLPNGNNETGHF